MTVAASRQESAVEAVKAAHGLDGAAFILDAPTTAPALWGQGSDVLWAQGEPLFLVGPQGVGKTTLGQQLALKRAGILGGDLLGMPVEIEAGRVLYIAADRPRQAARSFRRMVSDRDRASLALGLHVWDRPLPFDLGKAAAGTFADWVSSFPEVGTVIVDSLKDVAVGLAEDAVGATVSREHQYLMAAGIELATLHHQRKATGDNKRPRTLDDVYGSTFITGGGGSVVLLWGSAGDPIVELHHLKQPVAEVGPLTVIHDHDAGSTRLHEPLDLLELVRELGPLSAPDAAKRLYGISDPDRNQVEKVRRRLDGKAKAGELTRDRTGDERTAPVVYAVTGA